MCAISGLVEGLRIRRRSGCLQETKSLTTEFTGEHPAASLLAGYQGWVPSRPLMGATSPTTRSEASVTIPAELHKNKSLSAGRDFVGGETYHAGNGQNYFGVSVGVRGSVRVGGGCCGRRRFQGAFGAAAW